MPRALLSAAVFVLALAPPATAQTGAAAAQDTTAAASRPRWFTPWQVYLACQGAESIQPATGIDTVEARKAEAFCRLSLPRIGTRFAGIERTDWATKLGPADRPSAATIGRLVTRGEQVLLDRVEALGKISFGGASVQFDINDATLTDEDRRVIKSMSETIQGLVAADTNYVFEVVGFADRDGASDAKNLDLAQRRAQAVVTELQRNGILRRNIDIVTRLVSVPDAATDAQRSEARSVALNPVPGGQPLSAPAAAATAQGGGLDMSTLLIGTADFLVREAREQVQAYVMQRGALRICGDTGWGSLLPATCALVAATPAAQAGMAARGGPDSLRYFPGLEVIRDALREDLRALPYEIGRLGLQKLLQGSTGQRVRERAMLGIYLLNYVEEMGQARSPLVALERAVPVLADSLVNALRLDTLPVVKRIRQTVAVAGLLRSAREDLAAYWHPEILADSAALYTLKSLALNLAITPDSANRLGLPGGVTAYLDPALNAIRSGQALISSLEDAWRQLRTLRQDSSFAQARRDLLGGIAGDAVDLALLAFPDSALGSQADSLRALAGPVRELVTALTTNSPADALNSLLRLSRAVQAGGLILDGTQLRVLGFTTEIAQARQAGDVEAAFSRLVSDGPGYQGKRGGQGPYWRVNAYGGLAGGAEWLASDVDGSDRLGASFGLTLPIGIEVGDRTRRHSSYAVFVQLLDLGAIASARLSSGSSVETFPEFGFGSVVAPGLFYARGLSGKPFSVLWGLSYFPEARELDGGTEVGALRATASFVVDIPLFP
ncbi:MAG TPA: OmpA family protein [Longimicrobium sp.]|nr:OmpA family protein [Longimicrobium sp.]